MIKKKMRNTSRREIFEKNMFSLFILITLFFEEPESEERRDETHKNKIYIKSSNLYNMTEEKR